MNTTSQNENAQGLYSFLKEKLPLAKGLVNEEMLSFFCSTETGIEPCDFFRDFISRHQMSQTELMPVLWMAIDQVNRRQDGLSEEVVEAARQSLFGFGGPIPSIDPDD